MTYGIEYLKSRSSKEIRDRQSQLFQNDSLPFRDLRVGKIHMSMGEMLGVLRKRVRKTQTMHFCLASLTGQIALGAD